MTSWDWVLIGQMVLNFIVVVQHIRLKWSCERHVTMLRDWCAGLDIRTAELERKAKS